MRLRRVHRKFRVLVLILALVAMISGTALAHVDESWEWARDPRTGEPRRHLRIFCGKGVDEEWRGWLEEAIKNWHDAGTGWTFEIVDELQNSEITFSVGPVDEEGVLGYFDPHFDERTGELIGGNLVMNEDIDWGTEGDDAYNPVHALKHELGHAMRLDHSDEGNLMGPELGAGQHDPTPNEDDIAEAREASGAAREGAEMSEAANGKVSLVCGDDELTIGVEDRHPQLRLQPLGGFVMPAPLRVPRGMERVVAAVGIFPLDVEFSRPAELRLRCPPGAISGLDLVGDLHGHPLPPVDMGRLVGVRYARGGDDPRGHWEVLDVKVVWDAERSTAIVQVFGGGLYGVAAPPLSQPAPSYRCPFTDLPRGPVGESLVELRALDVYRGYPDGSARPDRKLSRLEFVTIAVRVAVGDEEAMKLSGKRPPFKDEIPRWGWGYVNKAVDLKLVEGYPDGTFRPDNEVTGNEAITILVRLLGGHEDTIARRAPWPAGYVEVAEALRMLDELRQALGIDVPAWGKSSITRGEMAVLTRSALWTPWRHDAQGAVRRAESVLERAGWWRARVKVATTASLGRRWVLRHVVRAPLYAHVTRLDVSAIVYHGRDRDASSVARGDSTTALVRQKTVMAIY